MKKILLYSGGMDSWLIDKIYKPDLKIYVDMNTKYSSNEINKLSNDVTILDFPFLGQFERKDNIIPMRNLYLVMIASSFADTIFKTESIEICLGATNGDRVLDKSQDFCDKTNILLNYLYSPQHWIKNGKNVRISVDFKEFTKTELLNMYLNQGGDIEEAFKSSFSCYNPKKGKECWKCKPCFRKFVSFALNGYKFDKKTKETCLKYILEQIYPQILNGTYGRKKEEEEILKVIELFKH